MRRILLVFLVLASLKANAENIYVATDGDDNSQNSILTPWSGIQKGIDSLQPGDTLFIRGGTYLPDNGIFVEKTGTPTAPIVICAYKEETVTIDFRNRPESTDNLHITAPNFFDMGALQINDSKYVIVKNLKVQYSRNAGINIRKCDSIRIEGCTTDYTHGSGISAWYSKNICAKGNKVFHSNMAKINILQDWGKVGAHEAISFAGVIGFEISGNEIANCDKEGIDAKQASSNGRIFNNYVHDMARQGIYVDGYPYLLPQFKDAAKHTITTYKGVTYNTTRYNVIVQLYPDDALVDDSINNIILYENIVHDCSMGITVSSEGGTPVDSVVIHHNLVYSCTQAGIHIAAYFGSDGPRSKIHIVNNTVNNAGSESEYWWSSGGIFLETHNIKDVTIRNNIAANCGAFQIGTTGQDYAAKNISIDHNLFVGEMNNYTLTEIHSYDLKPDHPISAYAGENSVNQDPEFNDSENADFTLKLTSPAINKGNPLPIYKDTDGSRNDIGRYNVEYAAKAPVFEFASYSFNIDENTKENTVVSGDYQISFNDDDISKGSSYIYEIIYQSIDDAFKIDTSNGAISVNDSSLIDYEIATSIDLRVRVYESQQPELADTADVTVFINDVFETGVTDALSASVNIWPNPFTDHIRISARAGSNIKKIYLTDSSGRIIMIDNSGNNSNLVLETEHLSAGVYIVNIIFSNGESVVQKLVH